MLTIGITGQTGCGKTALLRRIEARGGCGVDCDALYYDLLRTDGALRAALTDAFGDVFLPNGTLDRKKLGGLVFSDPAQLDILNRIVYFHVRRAVETIRAEKKACGCALFAVDAINLIQSGLASLCDVTVGVTAPQEVRLARIMARDGIERQYALLRIRAQEPEGYFRAHCTYILENGEISQEEFQIQAEALLDKIIKENAK